MAETTLELTLAQRIHLLGTLPEFGTYATLKLVRKLRETLSFDEEEHAAHGIREVAPGAWLWKPESSGYRREFVLGPKTAEIVAEALRRAGSGGSLRQELLSLHEELIPDAAVEEE